MRFCAEDFGAAPHSSGGGRSSLVLWVVCCELCRRWRTRRCSLSQRSWTRLRAGAMASGALCSGPQCTLRAPSSVRGFVLCALVRAYVCVCVCPTSLELCSFFASSASYVYLLPGDSKGVSPWPSVVLWAATEESPKSSAARCDSSSTGMCSCVCVCVSVRLIQPTRCAPKRAQALTD